MNADDPWTARVGDSPHPFPTPSTPLRNALCTQASDGPIFRPDHPSWRPTCAAEEVRRGDGETGSEIPESADRSFRDCSLTIACTLREQSKRTTEARRHGGSELERSADRSIDATADMSGCRVVATTRQHSQGLRASVPPCSIRAASTWMKRRWLCAFAAIGRRFDLILARLPVSLWSIMSRNERRSLSLSRRKRPAGDARIPSTSRASWCRAPDRGTTFRRGGRPRAGRSRRSAL